MSDRIAILIDRATFELAFPEAFREMRARMDPAKRYRVDAEITLIAEEIEAMPAKVMPPLVSSNA